MDDNELTTAEFARLLSWALTAYFWILCLIAGYCVWHEQTGIAIVWLLILSLTLPVAVKASVGIVIEKHYGTEIDAKDIAKPATAWVFVIFMLWMLFGLWVIVSEVFTQYLP